MHLKSLSLSNYRSFENVSLTFPEDAVIFISGSNEDTNGMDSNGAGKSFFSTAPFWILTGVPLGDDDSADDIIREGESQCEGTAEWVEGTSIVKIIRKRGKTNSLEFFVNDNLLNEKTNNPSDVQKTINDYFGIRGTQKQIINDFSSTNFLTYASVDMFVSKRYNATDRFSFISRMFDLERWIQAKKLAKEKADLLNTTNLEGQLSIYNSVIQSTDLGALEAESKDAETKIKNIALELITAENAKVAILQQIEQKTRLNKIIDGLNRKKTGYQNSIEAKRQSVSLNSAKKKEKEAEIKNTEESLNLFKKELESIPESKETLSESLQKIYDEERETDKKIITANSIISSKNQEILQKTTLLQKGLICPSCNSKLHLKGNELHTFDSESITSDIDILKSEIKSQESIIADLKIIQNEFKKQKTELNEKINQQNKRKELFQLIDKQERAITFSQSAIKIYEQNNITLEKEIETLVTEFERERIQLEKEIAEITVQDIPDINIVQSNINNLKQQTAEYQSKIGMNKEKKRQVEDAKEKRKDAELQIQKISKEKEGYTYWVNRFPEVRRMIIQSILPQIEEFSNIYLDKINTPFEIKLDTLKESKTTGNVKEEFNIEIYDKTLDTIMPIHKRSTGERKRIGFSVCFALQDIKNSVMQKTFDFRFFDEFLDNIDSTGLDAFLQMIQEVKGQKFIISHNSELKNRFSNRLLITKQNGISTAKWQ